MAVTELHKAAKLILSSTMEGCGFLLQVTTQSKIAGGASVILVELQKEESV